jgi:hypothetical protein
MRGAAVSTHSQALTPHLQRSQLAQWADVAVIVFSLRDASTFEQAFMCFNKLIRYSQDTAVVLVATNGMRDRSDP